MTVIGDDRAGLVAALAEAVSASGGNWEQSQLSRLAGKFAGIVEVTVSDERADALIAAVRDLDGLLHVTVYPGSDESAGVQVGSTISLDLLGNDHPGIVKEVTGVLTRHGISVTDFASGTVEAPMAGGRLFEAHLAAAIPASADVAALRHDLERLATELMVDISVDADPS